MHSITYSEMSAWDHCEKKWWFGYDQLLRSKSPAAPLNIGTATHNGIELYYKDPTLTTDEVKQFILDQYESEEDRFVMSGGWPRDRERIDKEKALVESMMHEYFKEAALIDNFEVISLEEEFNLPIINPYTGEKHEDLRLMGKIDGWCRINGYNFLMEHKTAAACAGDWWWKYLNQINTYSYAMQRKHGEKFAGTVINLLVKKIPSKPRFLKKGGLSKAKLVTTEEAFLKEIADHKLDAADFEPDIQAIRDQGNQFIKRKVTYTRKDEIDEIELKIWHAMQKKLNAKYYSKNKGDMCSRMCSFKNICNHDTLELREELFIKKASRHSELNGTNVNKG